MAPPAKIAPSMLASDFACMADEAKKVMDAGADWLHLDIMDGHFVPNLTFGAPVVASLSKHTEGFLDCHLMVTNPEDYVEPLQKAGAGMFTFHVEATQDAAGLADRARAAGMKAGVALKPGTPADAVHEAAVTAQRIKPRQYRYFLRAKKMSLFARRCATLTRALCDAGKVDMVLVMTVEPGFGGQKFQPEQMGKVRALRDRYPGMDLQVDGGLGPATIDAAAAAGANVIVAGSSVFGSADVGKAIGVLRAAVANASAE